MGKQTADQLVGRNAELEALNAALAQLDRGRGAVIELAGEPGLGKSRMLGELAAQAEQRDLLVLSGRASELEYELPFAVVVDALDEYLQSVPAHRLAVLDEDVGSALAAVFPSYAGRAPADAGVDERHRTHRAVRRLLEALAERGPVVVALDDLHWADPASVALIGSLLRRPPAAPVLLALALRPRQVPEPLAAALERAARAGTTVRLELTALSLADTTRLLGATPQDPAAARLHRDSGGNPYYLLQLARVASGPDGAEAGPDVALAGARVPRAVAAALNGELAVLPRPERQVLEAAAVAGDPFELDLAAEAAGRDEPEVMEALDELLRRDLVRYTDVPRRFRFRHPLVRGAVYTAAPETLKVTAHARCAAALAAHGAPAVEFAHHVARSARQGDGAAVATLMTAGAGARSRAPATAARWYRAALRLLPADDPERAGVLGAAADADAAAGHFAAAHAALLEYLERLPADALEARMAATAGCAAFENLLGRHKDAHARLMGALAGLDDHTPAHALPVMMELAVDAFYRLDLDAMCAWGRRTLATARAAGDRAMAASAAGVAAVGAAMGGLADARAALDEAGAMMDDLSDAELATCLDRCGDCTAGAALYLDRPDAVARAERVLAVARATGQGENLPVLYWSGTIFCARGLLAEAADVLDTAIELARLSDHAEGLGWNLFARSLTAGAEGDVETALAAAEEAAAALRPSGNVLPAAGAALAYGAALDAAGEPFRAAEVLVAAGGGSALPRLPTPWRARGFELLARSAVATGRRDDAVDAVEAAQALAAVVGGPSAVAAAARAAAALALFDGDARAAARRALAAAEAAEHAGAVVDVGVAHRLAGLALGRAGDDERAAAELERAAAIFAGCGATGHARAVGRELRRLGHRSPAPGREAAVAGAGLGSLSRRERQVGRLVAERRTNAQIAAELSVSQKTVETHMRSVFSKLGVSSRADVARLVRAAQGDGADD